METMRERVKETYAAFALTNEMLSCCRTGYSVVQLQGLPADATSLSLGCGNPVALASLQAGEVVLDIGSGAGLDVLLAAQKVRPTGKAIGLDVTEAMIQRAMRLAERAGYENVEFCSGDAEEMPLVDESVDVIISNCAINLTLDKGKVFREAYRILRPGGRLMISDIVTDKPLPRTVREDPHQWVRCVAGAIPDEEYAHLIAEAGFESVLCLQGLNFTSIGDVRIYSANVSAIKPVQ